MFATLFGRDT